MKKIILTSMAALLSTSAFASDVPLKVFVGGNLSFNTIMWSDDITDMMTYLDTKLPLYNFGVGGEAGVKYTPDQIYNAGITLAYDYLFNSGASISYPTNQIIDSIETGFSSISATFDNYIRIVKENNLRGDLVLGVGFASVNERVELTSKYLGNEKSDDSGNAYVFKIAYDGQITQNVDYVVSMRLFVPTNRKSEIDSMFSTNIGLRVNF